MGKTLPIFVFMVTWQLKHILVFILKQNGFSKLPKKRIAAVSGGKASDKNKIIHLADLRIILCFLK